MRKQIIDAVIERTKIYVGIVEGATRLNCVHALMLKRPMSASCCTKLDLNEDIPTTSQAFRTKIPVDILGPVEGHESTWKFDDATIGTLIGISHDTRETQNAGKGVDLAQSYVDLLKYCMSKLKSMNNGKGMNRPQPDVVGTDGDALMRGEKWDPVGTKKDEYDVNTAQGPFEKMWTDFLPDVVGHYLTSPLLPGRSMFKYQLKQMMIKTNANTEDAARDIMLSKIKDHVKAKKYWFKTTDKKTSQGDWTKNVPSDICDLVNFLTYAGSNETMIETSTHFISMMNNNIFQEEQRKQPSRVLTSKFLTDISDCIRKVSTSVVKLQTTVPGNRKQYLTALVVQSVAIDCFKYAMKYGPDPKEIPDAFKFLQTYPDASDPRTILEKILDTYPVYIDHILEKDFDKHEQSFGNPLATLYEPTTKTFKGKTFKVKYVKYFELGSYKNAPLSLKLLAAEDDEEICSKYEEMIKVPEPTTKNGKCYQKQLYS